ncbi:LacI family DNA-binding transcriptional regulator [Microbacterium excoecariae]|uniref:LacI family DNA-binding transcriptional regulator n=1 Tax=Microbacterium excoecariae TaxID=2715210 RepID=UPI001407E6AD|nr:LacI family DNA-binding transcriptional regulator [Microbacterium excoecariae]NHI15767.1 LacI family transcriptional regulator [Microbacterium excoecariae]
MKRIPGTRTRPSMKDVASSAGVSLGTVSNVLNNPEVVAAGTRERVERAIASLGFVRNDAARRLAAGRSDTVGFVVVDLGNSFFLDITRGIESGLDEHGKRLILANSDVDHAKQSAHLALFEEAQLAGMILAPLDGPLDDASAVRERGTPLVLVNWPGDDSSCGVVSDDEHGGYIAARHLIERGRTRLMFSGGPFSLRAIADRLRGARRAADEAGLELEVVETERITVRGGTALGDEIAARPPRRRPDGLVAASDALAAGAIHSLLVAGIRVPEDIAVIGHDNNHFAHDTAVPITSVAQPGLDMGLSAAALLIEEILAPEEHEHRTVTMQPTLVVRASSGA